MKKSKIATCLLDHLTITAPSLAAGAEFVRKALGVSPQMGGEHPRMATHKLLLRLGETSFLEIIASNPAAPSPERPRWFGLDQLAPTALPRLATWVVRTPDITQTNDAASEPLGKIEPMSRGELNWLITIPPDGSLPLEGIAPTLIEWQTASHPAQRLPDEKLSLVKLELFHHNPERIDRLLKSLPVDANITVNHLSAPGEPHLIAHINTPQGIRLLSGLPE